MLTHPAIPVADNPKGAAVTEAQFQVHCLGKSRDAFAPGPGVGHWSYAAPAFIAEAGDLDFPARPDCLVR